MIITKLEDFVNFTKDVTVSTDGGIFTPTFGETGEKNKDQQKKLDEWLEKAGWKHDHKGQMPLHPIRVKDHQQWFSREAIPKYIMSIVEAINQLQHTEEMQKRWEGEAIRHKKSIADYKKHLVETYKPIVNNASVWMRIPLIRLERILEENEIKGFFSTRNPWIKNREYEKYWRTRSNTENKMFGLVTTQIDGRPKYGYLSDNKSGSMPEAGLDMYGRVRIKFKNSMRPFVTIVEGDSLDENYNFSENRVRVIPSLLNDIRAESFFPAKFPKEYKNIEDITKYEYIEAQIHKKITLDDIEEIIFMRNPGEKILNMLSKKHIAFRAPK